MYCKQDEQPWMGYAQVDITPDAPVETVGFGRPDNRSRGVLHPLWAQVTVWQQGTERCCLAAIDHIGFSKDHADALRAQLGQALSTPVEKIMLCFSHTHAAPNESAEPAYFAFVCRQVGQAARAALAALSPARLAWGNGWADIGINRRAGCPQLDRRVGILKVCGPAGGLRLLLLRLTAHCNVLKGDNYLLSPDYFGTVRDVLQERYGCPVVVTQGAAGNVAPKYYRSALQPPDARGEGFVQSDTALQDMAWAVLRVVEQQLDQIMPQACGKLGMTARHIRLPAEVPTWERALEVADEARRLCGIDGTGWLAEVARLREKGVTQQWEDVEVQYFTLGGGCLCGVANEVLCEFALETARRLQDPHFYFGGYTNGCTGYFPTEEEFDQGGYEVYWSMLLYYPYHGRVFPLNRDGAAKLMEFVAVHAPARG